MHLEALIKRDLEEYLEVVVREGGATGAETLFIG